MSLFLRCHNYRCQEETQGGSDDERKGGKRMKMSDETRCEVRYKRVSTDLYRRGEPDQDMYVRKRQYVRKRECVSNNRRDVNHIYTFRFGRGFRSHFWFHPSGDLHFGSKNASAIPGDFVGLWAFEP